MQLKVSGIKFHRQELKSDLSLSLDVEKTVVCAYVVGEGDQSDYTLCNSISEGGYMMIFEKDFMRSGELSIAFQEHKKVHVWFRFVDDGMNNKRDRLACLENVDECIAKEGNSEREIVLNASSGSLDQFWMGTGLPPEVVKINVGGSTISILDGCSEVLQFCKPLVLIRLESRYHKEQKEVIRYLSRFGYQNVAVEVSRIASKIIPSAKNEEYMLAVHESTVSANAIDP